MDNVTNTQNKIIEILEAMKELLLCKNRMYGDSALKPKNIFYKGDAVSSVLIRLDDKLGRIMANENETPRVNDIADIIGYCVLLLVGMGVDSEDIKSLLD
ncbi:hypothetical protein [Treponema denticola]|uniref:hypothetical protein n=1 Tax=Treponema denticola TaxID=158 RepID=UPI00035296FE|nr:hypothetical protein [Treponema denticola]EPF37667.1 hypothetical protein HMPREF9732_00260 [Treponema denticola SP32]